MCWSQNHAPIGAAMLVALLLATQAHGQWHTLHNDYQRSGYSSEVVAGPYERKWWRDFHDEMIATRCEAIVAEDKVFVGTFAGTLYALDIVDGSTQWEFQADGPIGASPCYHDGHIYFGSVLGASADGRGAGEPAPPRWPRPPRRPPIPPASSSMHR